MSEINDSDPGAGYSPLAPSLNLELPPPSSLVNCPDSDVVNPVLAPYVDYIDEDPSVTPILLSDLRNLCSSLFAEVGLDIDFDPMSYPPGITLTSCHDLATQYLI